MANVKRGKKIIHARAPTPVADWIEKRADYYGSTVSAVIVDAVRKQMEAEAQAAKDRALASAGAA
jgi:hypothetical protein